jgi:hypothetical protein
MRSDPDQSSLLEHGRARVPAQYRRFEDHKWLTLRTPRRQRFPFPATGITDRP